VTRLAVDDTAAELELLTLLRDRTTGPAGHEDLRPLYDTNDLHDGDFDAVLADHLPGLPAGTGTTRSTAR
jgi:hypothetical protein